MAITVTNLFDGTKKRIIHVHVDTADVTDSVIYDYSADTNNPSGSEDSGKISRVYGWGHGGADGEVEFDGATDFPAVHFPQAAVVDHDFKEFGGIPNLATTPTGDLTFTTTGVNATDHIQCIVVFDKT